MKIIHEAPERITKLWGKQKAKDTEYRLLRYLLCESTEQGLLLHNVVTGEMVLLDETEQAIVSSLPAAGCPAMAELIEKHFLVPVEYDEWKAVQQLRKLRKLMNRKEGITGYTILPTTNCNARCFYCYEADCEKINMSAETAEAAVQFMMNRTKDNKVSISWFGGEPLVGMARIDQITNALTDAGIEYSSTMISNGYLFDEAVIKRAKELWHLKMVQITLDGTEEVYNRVKAYVVKNTNPYQIVLNNIEGLLKEDISVSVRMNLDYHNAEDLSNLIDELKARFSTYKKFNAYVYVLFDDEGFDPVRHTEADKAYLDQKKYELTAKLIDWVNPGRTGHLPMLKDVCCMADNDCSAIIYPDGSLAKCEHYMEEHLGSVQNGFTNQERLQEWKKTTELEHCKTCELYPKCIKLACCPSSNECLEASRKLEIEGYKNTMRKQLEKKLSEIDQEENS